jgi:hypothetical protein
MGASLRKEGKMPGCKPANEGIEQKSAMMSWYVGTKGSERSGGNRTKSAKNSSILVVLARFLTDFGCVWTRLAESLLSEPWWQEQEKEQLNGQPLDRK